jgi:hypothetical protein
MGCAPASSDASTPSNGLNRSARTPDAEVAGRRGDRWESVNMKNREIDPQLVQAAFDRLEAAKALAVASEKSKQAQRDLEEAKGRFNAAVEAHCTIETNLAQGITRQRHMPLSASVAA